MVMTTPDNYIGKNDSDADSRLEQAKNNLALLITDIRLATASLSSMGDKAFGKRDNMPEEESDKALLPDGRVYDVLNEIGVAKREMDELCSQISRFHIL